jgi:uncharacterized membrane protein
MKSLVAVLYPDRETAEQVRSVLVQAADEGLAELDDAVVVERLADGKVKLHQLPRVGKAAAIGAASGAAIGLLFLVPLLGAAVGAASAAGGTKLSDEGIDDLFLKDLGARLRPGAAAVIALGTVTARDELIERVKPYGGHVLQTRLSPAEEEHLRAALAAGGVAAGA